MSALLGYNVLFCYVVVLFILYCFELLLCIDLHWFALICIDLHWFTLFCVVMLWVCVCAKPLMCVPRLWRECQIFEFVCVKALNLCVSRLWICVCQGFDVSAANEYAHVPCRQQWNVYVSCWQQWMCMCRVGSNECACAVLAVAHTVLNLTTTHLYGFKWWKYPMNWIR